MKRWQVSIEGIVFLAIGAAVAGSGLIVLAQPDTYQAAARTKVPHVQVSSGNADGTFIDPYFVQTEFEVIRSEAVLGRVVDKLKVAEQWGSGHAAVAGQTKVEAIGLLQRQLDLRTVANTELIEIRAFSTYPVEAANIANTVAEVFQEFRREENRRLRMDQKASSPRPENSGMIVDPVVEIVDVAAIPTRPIRPNRPLFATVFLMGSGLCIFGFYQLLNHPRGEHPE